LGIFILANLGVIFRQQCAFSAFLPQNSLTFTKIKMLRLRISRVVMLKGGARSVNPQRAVGTEF